jgi:hypothetical protein
MHHVLLAVTSNLYVIAENGKRLLNACAFGVGRASLPHPALGNLGAGDHIEGGDGRQEAANG